MSVTPETSSDRFAEFTLPEGCISCGGPVSVRTTPAGAASYCAKCHWLSRPRVRARPNGLEISYSTEAQA
ncbi:hypothetical protein P2318_03960 [Myxococcaceae bacterium GXIMD 01537]